MIKTFANCSSSYDRQSIRYIFVIILLCFRFFHIHLIQCRINLLFTYLTACLRINIAHCLFFAFLLFFKQIFASFRGSYVCPQIFNLAQNRLPFKKTHTSYNVLELLFFHSFISFDCLKIFLNSFTNLRAPKSRIHMSYLKIIRFHISFLFLLLSLFFHIFFVGRFVHM